MTIHKNSVLSGCNTLTFHPDTLYSTSELDILTVDTYYDGNEGCYIPPPEEFDQSFEVDGDLDDGIAFQEPLSRRRPLWGWDWYLPDLARLMLTSEVDSVLMLVNEDPIYRVNTEEDLLGSQVSAPNSDDDSDDTDDDWEMEERILLHDLSRGQFFTSRLLRSRPRDNSKSKLKTQMCLSCPKMGEFNCRLL